MTEAEQFLEKKRKSELRSTFLQALTVFGLVSLAIAVMILYVQKDDQQAATTVIVDRVQNSLKAACAEADVASLPSTTQQDCQAAAANRLPELVQGLPGAAGAVGKEGPSGPRGETGATGATGPNGPKGDKGDKGDDGEGGAAGANGETVIGESGPKGDQGDKGDTGEKGDKGDTGATGEPGAPGPTCPPGFTATEQFVEGNPMTTEDDQIWLVCVKD